MFLPQLPHITCSGGEVNSDATESSPLKYYGAQRSHEKIDNHQTLGAISPSAAVGATNLPFGGRQGRNMPAKAATGYAR